jgi:hypothetical protein
MNSAVAITNARANILVPAFTEPASWNVESSPAMSPFRNDAAAVKEIQAAQN